MKKFFERLYQSITGGRRGRFLDFPSFASTRDTRGHPLFRSEIMRFAWRFYMWRLTQAGRWLLWPTMAFFMLTGVTLSQGFFVPFSYCFGLWFIALIGVVFFKPTVTFHALHGDRVCAGELLPIEMEVQNTGRRRQVDLFALPYRLPPGIDSVPEEGIELQPLERGKKTNVRLALRCEKRGAYVLPFFRVETDFPFGVMRTIKIFKHDRRVLVYPRFSPLSRLDIPSGRRYQPGGVALASVVGDSAEYIGNREFREGDNIRDIDWRATARLNLPIIREYREEYLLRVAVILDTHVPGAPRQSKLRKNIPFASLYDGLMEYAASRKAGGNLDTRRESFEAAVSVCAAVGDFLARQEYIVDIFAAGPNLFHLTAGRSLAYLDQILDILACIEENPDEPFSVIEPELLESLGRISTVICVFLDWNESRRHLVQNLAAQGVAVRAVVVRDAPCTIDPAEDIGILGQIRVLSSEDVRKGVDEF